MEEEAPIRVGVLVDNYPYSYLDKDGQLKGFAVDLLAAVEEAAKLKLQRVQNTTQETNAAFKRGDLDMLQSFAESPDRHDLCDFSVPYLPMTGSIIVRKGTKGISTLEDLRGKKVLVHPNSLGENALIKAGLKDSIVYGLTVEDCLRRLNAGEADATLATRLSAMSLCYHLGLDKLETVGGDIPGYLVRYAFAVKKGKAKLLADLNEGLAITQWQERDGWSQYDRIYKKWFSRVDPKGYTRQEIAMATAIGLAVALLIAIWALQRQRALNSRIEKQAQKLKAQEEQLRQTQKLEAIGTLASGIAHDFNNILTGIMGNTELARWDLPTDHPSQASLEEIMRSSERARALVRQILAFSRKAEPRRERLKLAKSIGEVMHFIRATTPTSIEIRHTGDLEDGLIDADPNQLHQVLMNLSANAVHAMRGKSGLLEFREEKINVGPEIVAVHPQLREGQYLRLSVKDTGSGMVPEVLQRIFEPFFTTKKPGEGTGLGLSVVHGIMQSHGGAITVYSQPGVGTVFHLYFPLVTSAPEEKQTQDEGPLPLGRGQLILFVDDEETLCSAVSGMLRRLGYEVRVCQDVEDALALFTRDPGSFDAIVSDMTMPRMSGLDFARIARQRRANIPFVLASGYLGEREIGMAGALGISEIVDKPITLRRLAVALKNALGS